MSLLTDQIKTEDVGAAVALALEAGYRHIDTAQAYNNEEGVGAALTEAFSKGTVTRDDVYITTKLWPGNPDWGQTAKTHDEVIAACRDSLKKLGVEKVDLYLIHGPFSGGKDTRLEQYRAVLECKRLGLATSIGVSNYGVKHLQEIEEAGLELPAANQLELHPYCQKPEIIGHMTERKIAAIAYSSLAPLSTWRVGQQSAKDEALRAEESPFRAIAEKHGWSEAQLLLHWGAQRGFAILPKSTSKERIEQNIAIFESALDEEEMASIAALDRNEAIAFGKPGERYDPVTCP